tara:strand:+ start:423 stop:971 length:549 start_codon:yes stop_codon:yes gene_type:complete
MALNNPLYWWESIYNLSEIKKINARLKKDLIPTKAEQGADGVIKTSQVKGVLWKKAKSYLNKFYESAIFRNNRAFGFRLFPLMEEEHLIYNVYSSGSEYGFHQDGTEQGASDIKLTALLNLSDSSYEGGELELQVNTTVKVPELNVPGNLVIFPSFILHRITPVTKGTRKSIAMLLFGPRFK